MGVCMNRNRNRVALAFAVLAVARGCSGSFPFRKRRASRTKALAIAERIYGHSWFVTELTSRTSQAPGLLTDSDNTSKSGVLYPLVNRAFILNGPWSALRFLASMKLPSRKGVHV